MYKNTTNNSIEQHKKKHYFLCQNKNNSPETIYKRYCKRGCDGAIDDNGIVTMSIFDFLLNKRSTEFYF